MNNAYFLPPLAFLAIGLWQVTEPGRLSFGLACIACALVSAEIVFVLQRRRPPDE